MNLPFFIGIILILGFGGYWLYNENAQLKANNIQLESAVAEQQAIVAKENSLKSKAKHSSNSKELMHK